MHAEFFDAIYQQAEGDEQAVPWQSAISRPLIADWIEHLDPAAHSRALVVAAGLGDDAAALAEKGLDVVAFDQAPTAVEWARNRHPEAGVDWRVADLFDPPREWLGAFDLVVEVFTIQSIPPDHAPLAAAAVQRFVAPGGTLVAIALVHDEGLEPGGPPWPLHPDSFEDLIAGHEELARHEVEVREGIRCVLVELRRPV